MNHPFKNFEEVTGKGYRSVTVWRRARFVFLVDRDDD